MDRQCTACGEKFSPQEKSPRYINFCTHNCYLKWWRRNQKFKNPEKYQQRLAYSRKYRNDAVRSRQRQRLEDKIAWCKEFLEQYGYKVIIEKKPTREVNMAEDMKGAMFGKDRQLPMGLKRKELRVADGAGGLRDYPDTAEEITSVQDKEAGKLRSHPMKPGQRQ